MRGIPHIASYLLCETFSNQAHKIWNDLREARNRGNIRDEETVTNDFLRDVQDAHPNDVLHVQFRKSEEKYTGADWEWWLSDGKLWFGLLVQAKILQVNRQKYSAIKHRIGIEKIPQVEVLIEQANLKDIDAIYAFYNYSKNASVFQWNCRSTSMIAEQLGCTLAHAHAVRSIIGRGGAGVNVLSPISLPLRCLVCCEGYTGVGGSLPARASSIVRELRSYAGPDYPAIRAPRLRDEPPYYVQRLLEAPLDERGAVIERLRGEVGPIGSLVVIIERRID